VSFAGNFFLCGVAGLISQAYPTDFRNFIFSAGLQAALLFAYFFK